MQNMLDLRSLSGYGNPVATPQRPIMPAPGQPPMWGSNPPGAIGLPSQGGQPPMWGSNPPGAIGLQTPPGHMNPIGGPQYPIGLGGGMMPPQGMPPHMILGLGQSPMLGGAQRPPMYGGGIDLAQLMGPQRPTGMRGGY